MRESLIKMEYYETYYYANIIHNILVDQFEYLRNMHNWHEDREVDLFLQPFPKWSVLHDFIQNIIEELLFEHLDDVTEDAMANDPNAELWVDLALRHHGISTQGFRAWLSTEGINIGDVNQDHFYDYHQELRLTGELDELLTQLSNEVFFLLFGNRVLLARLNDYAAIVVRSIDPLDLPPDAQKLLHKKGVLSRVGIPEWVRRAVFFRDRGMCASCNADLSGLVAINTVKHFDHIIPLADGGINDVTNIQLLCESCNLSKGRKRCITSNNYESWYT